MKTIGIILLMAGLSLGAYAYSMDTSVSVNYSGSSYGLPNRVNNLGLMQDRQNYLIGAGVLAIIGVILIVTAKQPKKENAG